MSVLKEIETQPGIKSNEIGNATGMPKKSIDRYLAELKRIGVISYKGSRKSGGLHIDEQIMK